MKFGTLILFTIYYLAIIRITDAEVVQSKRNFDSVAKYYQRLMTGGSSKLSELNMFITAMPKGGDVHHHYSGSIYVETYLDWLAKYNYCIYYIDNISMKIQKYTVETRVSTLSDEIKASCITAEKIRSDGNFYRELLKHWSNIDYVNHYHEQLPPDKQFFDTFGYFGPLNDKNYNEGLMWIRNTAISENVQYIETMLKGGPSFTITNALDNMLDSLTSQKNDTEIDNALTIYFNATMKNSTINATINNYVNMVVTSVNGINDENFTLRFQAYVTRGSKPSRVFSSLISCFVATTRSDLIVGVNIVGPENGIVAMRDYTLHMKMFRFLKKQFPAVKLAMHAGELILGMVPPEGLQFHIREAIEIAGASRIGHGVDIFYERNSYELLHQMKALNIAVEAVVSSNEFILGVKNDAHPMLVYKAFNVPIVIATDDAGVSRSTLSNEYLMYSDRYKPSYREVKTLIYNSIHYSFLDDKKKQEELNKLDARFTSFETMIANIVGIFNETHNSSASSSSKNTIQSFIILYLYPVYLLLKENI